MLRSLAVAIVILSPLVACAGLKEGDPAPPLKVSKWVNGKPVVLSEGKGKNIYVVEFWATWCPPCIQSIPHLTKLQKRFEKAGVVVVGVSVDDKRTLAKVEPFVKDMGKKMDYSVATDDGDATNEAYCVAAGVESIPHAFLIGKDGKIAWHGHPMAELGLKLAELTGDKEYAETEKKISDLQKKLGPALNGEQWDDALGLIDKLSVLDTGEPQLDLLKYQLLATKKKDAGAASKCGAAVVEKSDSPQILNQLSWMILTDEDFEGARDLKLALAAAKKANDVSKGQDWQVVDTYARALFETGDAKQAVELQKKVMDLASKAGAKDEDLDQLKDSLKRYEKGPESKEPKKE